MTILLVDDNKVNLFVMEKILKSAGYDNCVSLTSAQALYDYLKIDELKYKPDSVDLILLDIMMPKIDGIEACRTIRRDERYKNIQILFTTALDDKKKLSEALGAGGNDYITKPINKTELLARMDVALRLKQELDWHMIHDEKIENELNLAAHVQRSLLSEPFTNDKLAVQVAYKPSFNLAGDMYYWEQVDEDSYAVMLFDMMGHGISASLVCMFISSALRDSVKKRVKPAEVMVELNRYMSLLHTDKEKIPYYFTGVYMLINTKEKTIEYVNAGHPHGYAWLNEEKLIHLDNNSCAIGFFDDIDVKAQTISYESSAQIILFTDGVLEAMHPDEFEAERRMDKLAAQTLSLEKPLLDYVIPREQQENQPDDMCMLVIQAN